MDRSLQRGFVSIAIVFGLVSLVAGEPLPDVPDNGEDTSEAIGRVFAWICCAFYLSSMIPQIFENNRRKSTQGINIALFTAALCGNFCYTVGILSNPLAQDPVERRDFLLNAFPYLLGSAGYHSLYWPCWRGRTITFDITILMQYFRYYGQEPTELDREAIKRYLTADESWARHRWEAFRRKLQFPYSISFHDGLHHPSTQVIEGVEAEASGSESSDEGRKSLEEDESRKVDETRALLSRIVSGKSYGTQ
jgi:uncharacterized protein with PQ loop repeat